MIEVSNQDRVVFPESGGARAFTKGDVVAYYDAMASRILAHVEGRPLSIRRFPKGLRAPGFFQKNVPAHYPESMRRFAVPRSDEATKRHKKAGTEEAASETVYAVVTERDHVPFLANQGAIELHVPTQRADVELRADRIVVDLDPPANVAGSAELARAAARIVGEELERRGLASVPVATGSKGYHVVAPIAPELTADATLVTVYKLATLLAHRHDELTIAFRIANRGGRVFVDWLRNAPLATVVAPWSLRARLGAPIATPLRWDELERTAPDRFTLADRDELVARPDPLAELAREPPSPRAFVAAIDDEFAASGLELPKFDRFRS